MLSMITNLKIENYALIDKVSIDFTSGFTVITGETGSGKSIMLDALSLLMGVRADTKVISDKSQKTLVEAVFNQPDKRLKQIFKNHELDWDDEEIIIRREISSTGKSRSFVNDTPVTLQTLSELTHHLLDIHSQNSNILLRDSSSQLELLDSFTGNNEILDSYHHNFKEYVDLRNKIKELKEKEEKIKENKEFILFRLEQLDKLKPKIGELEHLEKEFELLSDSDKIKTEISDAYSLIAVGQESAIKTLNSASSSLEKVNFDLLSPDKENDILQRLGSLKVELRDIADTLSAIIETIDSNPERLEKIRTRIDRIYETMRRFKVKNESELVNLHMQLREDMKSLTGEGLDLQELEKSLKSAAKELKVSADKLTESRIEGAGKLASLIIEKSRPLGLPSIQFSIDINKGKLTSEGQDLVNFSCSFNKNHPKQPISSIASGGEISRMMLGIKSLMAEHLNMPTVIFDEIDTGVSGEIAHKMGKLMKEMSTKMQVMAVTHLPQVASNGDSHIKVFKTDGQDKTVSRIKTLNQEERIEEIAGMLSGTNVNEAARKNAKSLIDS